MVDKSKETAAPLQIIRRIKIERFRGIESVIWKPAAGVNIVLGGGDVGKSTVLDAVSLLFSPSTSTVLTDADYFRRDVAAGFCIEAVVALPDRAGISTQPKLAWPWEWDGEDARTVDIEGERPFPDDPVYRVRVRGTDDLDLSYEILQPNDDVDHFSVAIRRAIGLVRLTGDDRNDRDLRLVQGSALDRLVADRALRSRLGLRLAKDDVAEELTDDGKEALKKLDAAFVAKSLPRKLSVGITSPQGVSLAALVGLTASQRDVQLPLSSWGSGTRRLAALAVAGQQQTDAPLVVVDEIERGLEPYRQRIVVRDLQTTGSQVFVTTHSPVVLSAATDATFWYLDAAGVLGCVARGANEHRLREPEAYLSRLAVIAEGATEIGFLDVLLRRGLEEDLVDLGIVLSDGCGNDEALKILESLSSSALHFAAFVDNEGERRDPERWQKVQERLGNLLFRWPTGCLESNVIPLLTDDQIEAFITPPDGEAGRRLRTLADRLGIEDKAFESIRASAPDLRTLLVEAATGAPPKTQLADAAKKKTWAKHGKDWFKSREGGRELAEKIQALNLWPRLEGQLQPFIDAVAASVGVTKK